MPEEFRVWKEKVEAIEKKKQSGQTLGIGPATNSTVHSSKAAESQSQKKKAAAAAEAPAIVYETQADAVDAFLVKCLHFTSSQIKLLV